MANTNTNDTRPLTLQEMLAFAKKVDPLSWKAKKGTLTGYHNGGIITHFHVDISPFLFGCYSIKVSGEKGGSDSVPSEVVPKCSLGSYTGWDPSLRNFYNTLIQTVEDPEKEIRSIRARETRRLAESVRGIISL